jgi:hypothetical protein
MIREDCHVLAQVFRDVSLHVMEVEMATDDTLLGILRHTQVFQ